MSPTKRQMDALRYIAGYQIAHWRTPTLREVASGIGLKSKTGVLRLLDGLEERELISRPADRCQGIEFHCHIPLPSAPTGEPLYFVSVGGAT